MALELSKPEIQKVVKFIKEHIEEKHNCRVGYALKEVMGANYEKSFHNIEKVGYACIQDSKYTKSTPIEFEWDMSIHKSSKSWQQKYWVHLIILGALLGGLFDIGKEYAKSVLLPSDTKTQLELLTTQHNAMIQKCDSLSSEISLRDSLISLKDTSSKK